MRWLLERFSAFVHTYVPEGEHRSALLDWISRIEKVQARRNRVVHSWWSNPEVEGDPLKAMKLTTTKKGLKAWEFEPVSDEELSAIAEELAVVNREFGDMISHAQAAGPRWHLEVA